jgi:hypothetical protein
MMTGKENWKFAYPAFLAAMVVIGIIDYFLLRLLERNERMQTQGRAAD